MRIRHFAFILLCIAPVVDVSRDIKDLSAQEQDVQQDQSIKVIIFDLDGVLLRTSYTDMLRNCIGSSALSLTGAWLKNLDLQAHTFAILNRLPITCDERHISYTPQGHTFPPLLCNWLAGVDGYDSYTVMRTALQKIDYTSLHEQDRAMYYDIIKAMCHPAWRSRSTHIMHKGLNLLRQLKHTHTGRFAILSNYDPACFQHVYHKRELQPVFAHIPSDHIFVSGYLHTVKTNPEAYYTVCDAMGVTPQECLLIDDQYCNIKSARSVGMHACHFTGTTSNIYRHIQKNYLQNL